MTSAPRPADDDARVAALRRYRILDSLDEKEYDDITRLVSQICETPMANISFVDSDRQWFKSVVGLKDRQTERDIAFCGYSILGSDIFVVPDALADPRFADNPLVQEDPGIRFYAGAPLETADGYRLGALCAIDRVPRQLNEGQIYALRVLARHVVNLLELRRRNADLHRLSEEKSRLMAIMAHDLRSPVSSLRGMLSVFDRREMKPDETRLLVEQLQTLLKSTSFLIENVVAWASEVIESPDSRGQHLQLNQRSIELEPLIAEIYDSLSGEFDAKQNRFAMDLAGNQVMADRNALLFVLRNLLANANKFTRAGQITVSARDTGTEVVVLVRDSGVGMEPEQLASLFSWEHRVVKRGTDGEAGSGLALLLCHDLCERMGARLVAASSPGKGSEFSVVIPASPRDRSSSDALRASS